MIASLSRAFVAQGDRVLPVFPMKRAALRLRPSDPRPRKLLSRRKDVARMLRNAPPHYPLELRVSSDLPTACAKLREHHPSSWVGSGLEAVWSEMAPSGGFVTLELWCNGRCASAFVAALPTVMGRKGQEGRGEGVLPMSTLMWRGHGSAVWPACYVPHGMPHGMRGILISLGPARDPHSLPDGIPQMVGWWPPTSATPSAAPSTCAHVGTTLA